MSESDSHHNELGGASGNQLRAYVSRIENIEEEVKALNDDKKDIYAEAKAVGFDKRALKKVIARRRMDRTERNELDALVDLYEHIVNGNEVQEADPLD